MSKTNSDEHFPRSPHVKIAVRQFDIDLAEKASSSHCMVADALKNCVSGAQQVSVDIQTIRFSDKERRLRFVYLTPRSVQAAIVAFDQGEHVTPFSFVLKGGHVAAMGTRNSIKRLDGPSKPPTPNSGRRLAAGVLPTNPILRTQQESVIPRRVGGQTPPRISVRREFGLRAFK